MGLDRTHPAPRRPGDPVERSQLVEDVVPDPLDRHRSIGRRPKPSRSGYEGWAPTATPAADGRRHRLGHDLGIAGVEAAGHVRRRHDVEHRLVVADAPGVEALADVGVEVERATRRHASIAADRLRPSRLLLDDDPAAVGDLAVPDRRHPAATEHGAGQVERVGGGHHHLVGSGRRPRVSSSMLAPPRATRTARRTVRPRTGRRAPGRGPRAGAGPG